MAKARRLLTPLLHCSIAPLLLATAAQAVEPTKEQAEFFEKKIQPIFNDTCSKCHSEAQGKTKGGLALDTRDGLTKGSTNGPVVVPGNPAKSPLIARITSKDADEVMPPKDKGGPLTSQQIADLTQWVKMGAPDPRKSSGAIAANNTEAARKHWAFQPVKRQTIPRVKDAAWVATPVDAFILTKLEQKGMTHCEPAPRATLIRRAYLDLTGLPPAPWEVQAFIDDKSADAWQKIVERLLASPHYGERWGRHWLDVARYADTMGEAPKKGDPRYVDAWTYRDYVINAFNADKPFDQFIVEQIAADKLTLGKDNRALAALGFLTVGERFGGNKNDIINDRIDAVTKGFIGLTVTCARCHDHMFDPIPTKDYYSLHGIFNSSLEPEEKPLLVANLDRRVYEDYVKKRELAVLDAQGYVADSLYPLQSEFRKAAGEWLIAANMDGKARQEFTKKWNMPSDDVQLLLRPLQGRGKGKQNHPVFGPWYRFIEIPEKEFATKAREIAQQLAANADPKHPINPFVAAAFRGPTPKKLEDVAAIYTTLFQKLETTWQATVALSEKLRVPPAPFTDANLEELRIAPFPDDFTFNVTSNDLQNRVGNRSRGKLQQILAETTKLDLTHPGAPARAMAMQDAPKPQDSPVFIRGEAQNKGPVVPRRFLELISGEKRPVFKEGSGRLDLARSVASKTNPLTARVIINRIWLHHFGEGIVTTPDDFGTQSAPPSHPELLDYLAARFMDEGWSIKRIHRLIMMSNTYQQSSETNPKFAEIDSDNRLLWRQNIRRLEYEALRDSLLSISGKLDPSVGGKPVNITSEPFSPRRSIYGYIDRQMLPEVMNHFDFANPEAPMGKRHDTIVPQQALYMMNSPLLVQVARDLMVRKEMAGLNEDWQRVHALYWITYQRPPRPDEMQLGLSFIKQSSASSSLPEVDSASDGNGKSGKARKPQQAKKKEKANMYVIENEGFMVERKPLTAWEEYVQALLLANEFTYYN